MKRKQKTDTVQFKLTPHEKTKFTKLAASLHTDLSELIRQLLHKEASKGYEGGVYEKYPKVQP